MVRSCVKCSLVLLLLCAAQFAATAEEQRYLYVVTPGIRNYLEFGGSGILVFDLDDGCKFVKRIATPASLEKSPDNIKGVCAHAESGRLYFTTRSKLYAVDLFTEKTLWEQELPGGTDRMSITPNGKLLYVPSFEQDTWNVVEAETGKVITEVETKSGAHNTVVSRDGERMYLGGLRSPILFVADTNTHEIVQQVGPLSGAVRPFTVNGARTRAYVCVNDLLGFEIADLVRGKKLHRVEVEGFKPGAVKRHGCPSHGVGLTPNEREVWVVDAANSQVHVFDNTVEPPRQQASIPLREQPGWITFSLNGQLAFLSTGEVIDTATKKIVAALADEKGNAVHSEKVVEIHFRDGQPVATGDQFGVGRLSNEWDRVIRMLPDLHLLEPEDSRVIYRESITPLQATEGEPAKGSLAIKAEELTRVKSATGDREYKIGTEVLLGKDGRTLTFPLEGKPVFLTAAELFPPQDAPNSYRHRVGHPEQNMLYGPGRWFHDRQVEVTYRRAEPKELKKRPLETSLPKTLALLKEGKGLTIGISGDSISFGGDASALANAPPHQPPFPNLVAAQLQASYKTPIVLKNRAIGGWSVANGVADIDALLAEKPQLIVIAYGMNDVGRKDPAWFKARTQEILARIAEQAPETEVILVACMLGHKEWIHTPREMFAKYRDELASLTGPGIALADLTAVWEEQLQWKHDLDLTGNGLNHPNDYGHRLYAREILALLIP